MKQSNRSQPRGQGCGEKIRGGEMKKLITAMMAIVMFVPVAYAADIDMRGLTAEQRAQLVIQAEQMKKKETPTVEKVSQWVELGKNVGVALTSTAKELGVAADTFLQSTTGKITIVLIFWKIMGRDLVHMFVGIGLLCTLVPLWVYLFRKMCLIKSVRTEYPTEKFKKVKIVEHYGEDVVDGTRVLMFIVLAIIIFISLLVIFG